MPFKHIYCYPKYCPYTITWPGRTLAPLLCKMTLSIISYNKYLEPSDFPNSCFIIPYYTLMEKEIALSLNNTRIYNTFPAKSQFSIYQNIPSKYVLSHHIYYFQVISTSTFLNRMGFLKCHWQLRINLGN